MEDMSAHDKFIYLFCDILLDAEDYELGDPDASLPSDEWLSVMELRLAPFADAIEAL